jgi:hypothetical protein
VDSIEEDTEELEMTFEEYLVKINNERIDKHVPAEDSISVDDLDLLIKRS